jgi:hypothetical protein
MGVIRAALNAARFHVGAAVGQAKLKPRRASVVREAWDRLLDFAIAPWLGVLDRLAPLPETSVDRAISRGERAVEKSIPRGRFRPSGAAAHRP